LTREIRKTVLAESDLVEIWQHTFQRWSAAQADRYPDELDFGIRQLVDSPQMGAKHDNVRPGNRVPFVNSHAIYYTTSKSTVLIVRLLHNHSDSDRHL